MIHVNEKKKHSALLPTCVLIYSYWGANRFHEYPRKINYVSKALRSTDFNRTIFTVCQTVTRCFCAICWHRISKSKYQNLEVSDRNITYTTKQHLSILIIQGYAQLGLFSLNRRRITDIAIPVSTRRRSDDRVRFIVKILIPMIRCLLSE